MKKSHHDYQLKENDSIGMSFNSSANNTTSIEDDLLPPSNVITVGTNLINSSTLDNLSTNAEIFQGFDLLEQDFENIISDWKNTPVVKENITSSNYLSILTEKWPDVANKIVNYVLKPKLRKTGLGPFLTANRTLLMDGSRNHIIAFSILPIFINTSRKINTGRRIEQLIEETLSEEEIPAKKILIEESYTVTADEAFDSFITYIKNSEGLKDKKTEHENLMRKLNLPLHPYIIFVGDFKNTTAYLIFKDQDIYYKDPLEAIENCFKIHISLRSLPIVSGPFWQFIAAEIYNFNHLNISAPVNTFRSAVIDILLKSMKSEIISILSAYCVPTHVLTNVIECIDSYKFILDYVDTPEKRLSLLKKKGFIGPVEIPIGFKYEPSLLNDRPIFKRVDLYGVYISLPNSLKNFLEIPGVFKEIYKYMKQVARQENIVTNILQSRLWIKKYKDKFKNDIVMPLYIFFDDVECGNPPGSHAGINKFGALYTQIACLPPWFPNENIR
ncbi:hypothetical protein TKK_0001687 [Trichogramma kaykai]